MKLERNYNSAFSGFAKGYIRSQQGEFFRVLLEVKNGWVVTKKVWDNKGRKKILRSYSRGVLDGRYIDWYPNGNRKLDGLAMDGEKKGCGRMVRQTEFLKSGTQMEKRQSSRFLN
ncbi:MAG: hypothetical protein CMI23_03255 [Opitutae bacterium]|nr:hypothetical protein [Opitutae bacterium]